MTREKIWTTRREAMALLSGALAGVVLGGDARAQGAPRRGGILRVSFHERDDRICECVIINTGIPFALVAVGQVSPLLLVMLLATPRRRW